MQDAEDDENLGFDLSATWASFAGSPAPKLKQASTCNSAPMGEPGCQTDAMSVGHAAPDVSGAFSIDAAAADRVSDVLRSPAPARMLLQKFVSPTAATAGAMQLQEFPGAAADRRRQPAASMRGRQVKNKLWRIGKDVGPWISGSGRRAVKCVEPPVAGADCERVQTVAGHPLHGPNPHGQAFQSKRLPGGLFAIGANTKWLDLHECENSCQHCEAR